LCESSFKVLKFEGDFYFSSLNFLKVVQYPGDLVVLYPSAAHFGFNTGPNIAQAINIGTKSWLAWGINAKKCTCM